MRTYGGPEGRLMSECFARLARPLTGLNDGALWAYRTALTLIMLAGLFLSGCRSNQVIVQGEFPTY